MRRVSIELLEIRGRTQIREQKKALRDIFGKDNFFAEIMDHGIGIERRTMNDLIKLAKDLQIPLLATNDLHYTHAHDADAHAALLCVQSASTLADPNRFKFDANEFYLKSPSEMHDAFAELAGRKIAPGGYFHAATDWPEYAAQIDDVRAAVREQVESLGARFLAIDVVGGEQAGGYAAGLDEDHHHRERVVGGVDGDAGQRGGAAPAQHPEHEAEAEQDREVEDRQRRPGLRCAPSGLQVY